MNKKSKKYIAKFRQGSGPIAMNAIDYYKEGEKIIRHSWAMGGETKEQVDSVPDELSGYRRLVLNKEDNSNDEST